MTEVRHLKKCMTLEFATNPLFSGKLATGDVVCQPPYPVEKEHT